MQYRRFNELEEFEEYIVNKDPMKIFNPKVREINWESVTRKCFECGDEFEAVHPAKVLCDKCSISKKRKHKLEPVINRLVNKRVVRECVVCGNDFILSAPAMKMCLDCSPSGGEVI